MMMVGPADITRRMRADSALHGRPASDGMRTTVGRVGTVGAGATAWRFDPDAARLRWRSKLVRCATSTCIAVSMAGAVAPSHAGGDRSLEVQRHRLADRLLDIFATPQCVKHGPCLRDRVFVSPALDGLSVHVYGVRDMATAARLMSVVITESSALPAGRRLSVEFIRETKPEEMARPFWAARDTIISAEVEGQLRSGEGSQR